MALIEVKNVVKRYYKKEVLGGVSFYANKGECVGIVGANGCGKTTLLGIISGAQGADSGEMLLDGVSVMGKNRLLNGKVGYVPQENPLMEDLSVCDNLKFWYCDSSKNLKDDIENGTAANMGLAQVFYTRVSKLSCGMKKRLSITCALASEPEVLIMDEPGASLDIVGKEDVHQYVREYVGSGGTVIITSHEESELKLCDRMYLMKAGELMELEDCPSAAELMRMIKDI